MNIIQMIGETILWYTQMLLGIRSTLRGRWLELEKNIFFSNGKINNLSGDSSAPWWCNSRIQIYIYFLFRGDHWSGPFLPRVLIEKNPPIFRHTKFWRKVALFLFFVLQRLKLFCYVISSSVFTFGSSKIPEFGGDFTPIPEEMIQFDKCCFWNGLKPPTRKIVQVLFVDIVSCW